MKPFKLLGICVLLLLLSSFAFAGQPYWREETDTGNVWFTIDYTAGETKTYTIDTTTGTYAPSPTEIFTLFDDFNDNSINTSLWSITSTCTETAGKLQCGDSSADADVARTQNTSISTTGTRVKTNAYIAPTSQSTHSLGPQYYIFFTQFTGCSGICWRDSGGNSGSTGLSNAYHNFEILTETDGKEIFIGDGTQFRSYDGAAADGFVTAAYAYDANTYSYNDWIIITDYNENEPDIGVTDNGDGIYEITIENGTASLSNYAMMVEGIAGSGDLSIRGGNLTITAIDQFNNDSITTFNATVNNTFYNTTTGTITLPYLLGETDVLNITVNAENYQPYTNESYNTSNGHLVAELSAGTITFSATELFTDNGVTANFTFNSQTKESGEAFTRPASGIYNVTFSADGYYNKTESINFSSYASSTYTIDDVYSARVNITAVDLINGTTVNTFTINTLNDNLSIDLDNSTTNGTLYLNLLQNYTYTFTIDSTDYAITSKNLTLNYSNAYEFELFTTNSINVTFKDIDTGNLVSGINISLEFISDDYAVTTSTTTGYKYVDLLVPSSYILRYTPSSTYNDGQYRFNVINRSTDQVTIYLINESVTTAVTVSIIDEIGDEVEGAVVKVLRYDPESNTYLLQDVITTNFEGEAQTDIELNDEYYKFIVEYPEGTVKKITEPSVIYGTQLTIPIQIAQAAGNEYFKSLDVTSELVYNENTYNFRWDYSDSNNAISEACLYVYRVVNFAETFIDSSCSESSSGTILLGITPVNNSKYVAKAYVNFDGSERFIDKEEQEFRTDVQEDKNWLFWCFIITLGVVLMFVFSPALMITFSATPLLVFTLMKLINIEPAIAVSIQIVMIIVAVAVGKNG